MREIYGSSPVFFAAAPRRGIRETRIGRSYPDFDFDSDFDMDGRVLPGMRRAGWWCRILECAKNMTPVNFGVPAREEFGHVDMAHSSDDRLFIVCLL